MAAVNEAYRVLGDPGRRVVYDRGLGGSAAGTGSAAMPSYSATTATRPTTYNYPTDLAPAKIPWKLMGVMALVGSAVVIVGAALARPAVDPTPDGLLRPGSCVEIAPNGDADEVLCTGEGDIVVDRLVPSGVTCPVGTSPHRDRLGLGTACVKQKQGA